MSTIRKRGSRWQAQIRRNGFPSLTRSFASKADAQEWARHYEVMADRGDLPQNTKILGKMTLRELVVRYRDEVTILKRGAEVETIVLNAFLREPICRKRLSVLTTADFAAYRDKRLETVACTTISRQLAPIHNMFEIAHSEWSLPMKENPLAKLPLRATGSNRQKRLSQHDLLKLIATLKKTGNPLILPIIQVALETAMRRGELE